MTKTIRFDAFDMNCVGHKAPARRARPQDKQRKYKNLDYGVDFGQYAPTDLVNKVETNAMQPSVEYLAGGGKSSTIDELTKFSGIGGLGPVFVGSYSCIADILQEWAEGNDVDGFNIAYVVTPTSSEDVVGYVVPELQRRGVYPTAYKPRTWREKLFGADPYLPKNHPVDRYRDIDASRRLQAQAADEVQCRMVAG